MCDKQLTFLEDFVCFCWTLSMAFTSNISLYKLIFDYIFIPISCFLIQNEWHSLSNQFVKRLPKLTEKVLHGNLWTVNRREPPLRHGSMTVFKNNNTAGDVVLYLLGSRYGVHFNTNYTFLVYFQCKNIIIE